MIVIGSVIEAADRHLTGAELRALVPARSTLLEAHGIGPAPACSSASRKLWDSWAPDVVVGGKAGI